MVKIDGDSTFTALRDWQEAEMLRHAFERYGPWDDWDVASMPEGFCVRARAWRQFRTAEISLPIVVACDVRPLAWRLAEALDAAIPLLEGQPVDRVWVDEMEGAE